jgi:hypothetical protein
MIALSYEPRYKVLLARITGMYSSQDIADIDAAVIGITGRYGPAHLILDFQSADGMAVPTSKILQRGRQPPLNPGCRRISVVSRPDLYEAARLYGAQQTLAGTDPPKLVATLREAFGELNLIDPQFESPEGL